VAPAHARTDSPPDSPPDDDDVRRARRPALIAPADSRGPFPAPSSNDFFFDPVPVFGHVLRFKPAGIDLSINRVVLLEFLVAGTLCALFAVAFRRARVVPQGSQNILEALMDFVRKDLVDDVVGVKGRKYTAYFMSLFFFLLFANLTEIVPGIEFPVNSRTALPVALAVITLVLFVREGIAAVGLGRYVKDTLFPPGVPLAIYVILTPIEFISTFLIRPFTLFIRLSANMIAGHLLLGIMYVATAYLLCGFTAIFAAGSFLGAIVFTGFELFVASLQAYIFVLLTGVYLAGAMEPQH